jgi:hypothetical protein
MSLFDPEARATSSGQFANALPSRIEQLLAPGFIESL